MSVDARSGQVLRSRRSGRSRGTAGGARAWRTGRGRLDAPARRSSLWRGRRDARRRARFVRVAPRCLHAEGVVTRVVACDSWLSHRGSLGCGAIAVRALDRGADPRGAAVLGEDPRTVEERRAMTDVLGVAARQLGDPVAGVVLVEPDDRADGRQRSEMSSSPSTRSTSSTARPLTRWTVRSATALPTCRFWTRTYSHSGGSAGRNVNAR